MTTSLDIIIVNWNSGPLLRNCISSIARAKFPTFQIQRVVVVDNDSTDGSALELVSDDLPLSIVLNSINEGYASACNCGARGSRADYLLFLNPDTYLFTDTLSNLLDYLEAHENSNVGICGVRLLSALGTCTRTCARLPNPWRIVGQTFGLDRLLPDLCRPHFMREWDHFTTRHVDQVAGAFLVIRRCVFEDVGGFDDRFFLYFEDVDLCARTWLAGWKVVHFAGAQALHYGGGCTNGARDKRLFYNLRSRILFVAKYYGLAASICVLQATIFFEIPLRIVRALIAGTSLEMVSELKGSWMFLAALPNFGRALGNMNNEKTSCSHPI